MPDQAILKDPSEWTNKPGKKLVDGVHWKAWKESYIASRYHGNAHSNIPARGGHCDASVVAKATVVCVSSQHDMVCCHESHTRYFVTMKPYIYYLIPTKFLALLAHLTILIIAILGKVRNPSPFTQVFPIIWRQEFLCDSPLLFQLKDALIKGSLHPDEEDEEEYSKLNYSWVHVNK